MRIFLFSNDYGIILIYNLKKTVCEWFKVLKSKNPKTVLVSEELMASDHSSLRKCEVKDWTQNKLDHFRAEKKWIIWTITASFSSNVFFKFLISWALRKAIVIYILWHLLFSSVMIRFASPPATKFKMHQMYRELMY